MTIVAIEPHFENYQALLKNIYLNNFLNIIPLYAAASDSNGLGCLSLPEKKEKNDAGFSGAQIRRPQRFLEKKNRSIVTITIDLIYYVFGNIDFVKIDVDGVEAEIIFGARLSLEYIQSILFEVDKKNSRCALAVRKIEKNGFTQNNIFNFMPNHSRFRRAKEGHEHIENIVFTREKK